MKTKDLYSFQIEDWISKTKESDLTAKDKEKRILELCHLASFGMALLSNNFINDIDEIKIHQSTVEPDFIIKYKGETIGIELARLVNENAEQLGAKRKLLKQSAKLFWKKYPSINTLANINFKDSFDARLNDTDEIRNEIADFVCKTVSKQETEMPNYINSIFTMRHTLVSFELSGAYMVGALDIDNVNSVIEKKCGKINNYKVKSGVDRIWLLLIVAGASPDSDYSYIDFASIKTCQGFDEIFLLNDFKKMLYRLSDNHTGSNMGLAKVGL